MNKNDNKQQDKKKGRQKNAANIANINKLKEYFAKKECTRTSK